MDKLITVYHGSTQIVEVPIFGEGRKNNDFGLGFYCTESNDLAKEWAVSSLRDGFSNRYTLDTEYLNILNLNRTDRCHGRSPVGRHCAMSAKCHRLQDGRSRSPLD